MHVLHSFESSKIVSPAILVSLFRDENLPHIIPLLEMVPQVLLCDILRKSYEVEGRYVILIPPICSIVALLSAIPVPGMRPSRILSETHSIPLYCLTSVPNSLPLVISLSTQP